MGTDPKAEAQRWLEQAEADLHTAERLVDIAIFYAACFFAQQAAEKALKAVHYAAGVRAVLGHSVGALCRAAAPHTPAVAEMADEVEALDLYYIPTRYPNSLPDSVPARIFKAGDAARALGLSRRVVGAVRAHLPRA